MNRLAVIGCSGFAAMLGLEVLDHQRPDTPYGPASAPVIRGFLGSAELFFLPRHGMGHGILPHRFNYRANLWALNACGAEQVVGLAAVGGIADAFGPRVLAVPDQIIDYTYGRAHSFSDGGQGEFCISTSPGLIVRSCAKPCSGRRGTVTWTWKMAAPTA